MKVKDRITGNTIQSKSEMVIANWKNKPKRYKPVGGGFERQLGAYAPPPPLPKPEPEPMPELAPDMARNGGEQDAKPKRPRQPVME